MTDTTNSSGRTGRGAYRVEILLVSFAALFSLMGVLQRVNDAGLIADSLKWFLTAMVLLLVLALSLLSSRWLQVHQRND